MWGKKKETKPNYKTFIDGEEQEDQEIPVPNPDETAQLPSDATAHEPEQVQVHEPTPQPEVEQFNGECILCFDFRWYADHLGVWHACPRCNKDGKKNIPTGRGKPAPADEEFKPSKGNLYEFRVCKDCGARNEIHKKKKKWNCESCGVSQ